MIELVILILVLVIVTFGLALIVAVWSNQR